jgi:hypothetical protein
MYADETYLKQEPSSMSDWEFGFSHLKLQQDLENHFTRLALSSDPNGVPSVNSSSLALPKQLWLTSDVKLP